MPHFKYTSLQFNSLFITTRSVDLLCDPEIILFPVCSECVISERSPRQTIFWNILPAQLRRRQSCTHFHISSGDPLVALFSNCYRTILLSYLVELSYSLKNIPQNTKYFSNKINGRCYNGFKADISLKFG